MRSLSMMAIVSIIALPTVRAFMGRGPLRCARVMRPFAHQRADHLT
jgi:hypothetical protein